ncbi:MAG: hypothetical protein R2710_02650 [Acidimicrobiales bacterium]
MNDRVGIGHVARESLQRSGEFVGSEAELVHRMKYCIEQGNGDGPGPVDDDRIEAI